ncbi:cytochrome c oxidase assembly protein COX16 homolog, mitochondrial-like [Balaenoptera ricei]|uniref:cytochrome c oxidase assembly protein COX16 homolog, mitochondrial-like n=1 Tax=Balaenoptera ricei TaxID=2746895 RepID=UPI0028BEF457|nr:cytochrome c oxidase assembly protein COX16 homolog, mitochondrial-like [Balaenoptera ricei]
MTHVREQKDLGNYGNLTMRFWDILLRSKTWPDERPDDKPYSGWLHLGMPGIGTPVQLNPLNFFSIMRLWKDPALGGKGKELLIIGGSFGLCEFSQIHYDAVKIKIDPELEKKLKMNKVSLESEYEKIKDSTFDEWKNIQGPRPWEDPDLLQGRNPEILKTKTTCLC